MNEASNNIKIYELERKSKRQMSIAIASLIGFIITIMISFFVLKNSKYVIDKMLDAKDTISDLFCSNNEFQAELTEISPDGNIRIWYTLKRVDYYYYEDLLISCFIFLEIFFGIMGLSFFSLWIDNQDTLGRYK